MSGTADNDAWLAPALAARFSLAGRRAVLTGAASGIGRAAAMVFAQAGAALMLVDRDEAGLAETARLVGPGREVTCHPADITDADALGQVASTAAAAGGLDVWANIAGIHATGRVTEVDEAEFDRVVAINLKGTFFGCAAAARVMEAQRRGVIVNISSGAVDWPGPRFGLYGMTKAGVNLLTKTLAHELGPLGVRVNAVAPGFIDTPMVRGQFRDAEGAIDQQAVEDLYRLRASQTVIGRLGQAEDIALAMLYLASDASSFMTGQILRPNGGIAMP